MYGILAQWAQYNKFVERRSKNWALMNWRTASMDLNDDQTKTRSIDLNQFTIRGGKSSYKSTKPYTNIILMAIVFSLYFSDPSLMKGLLHYIALFEPSWSYTYWSSEPLFEYLSYQTPSWAFCEL